MTDIQRITKEEEEANNSIGILITCTITASEYLKEHNPTKMGSNTIGVWYEHPIYGDEIGMLVVPTGSNKIHLTYWRDVPTDDELGITFSPAKVVN